MKKRTLLYKKSSGKMAEFDISKKACHPFGFYHKDRVLVPYREREATVIGVHEGVLWLHLDGSSGATFDTYKNIEEYTKAGYQLIKRSNETKKD